MSKEIIFDNILKELKNNVLILEDNKLENTKKNKQGKNTEISNIQHLNNMLETLLNVKFQDVTILSDTPARTLTLAKSENIAPSEAVPSEVVPSEADHTSKPASKDIIRYYNGNKHTHIGTIVGKLKRVLKGGILIDESNKATTAFVSETQIRNKGFQHGDKLIANLREVKRTNHPNKPFLESYEYELVEVNPESDAGNKDIVAVTHGLVEKHPDPAINQLVVTSCLSTEGDFKPLNEVDERLPQIIHLDPSDMVKLKPQENDIIDFALYETALAGHAVARIRWLHPHDTEVYNKPKKSSFYKDNTGSFEKENTIDKSEFKDLKIAVVGGDYKRTAYRECIEQRGGEMIELGDHHGQSPKNLKAKISKVDMAILDLLTVDHMSTNSAVEVLKEHNIPYKSLQGGGRTTFLSYIREMKTDLNERRKMEKRLADPTIHDISYPEYTKLKRIAMGHGHFSDKNKKKYIMTKGNKFIAINNTMGDFVEHTTNSKDSAMAFFE